VVFDSTLAFCSPSSYCKEEIDLAWLDLRQTAAAGLSNTF